MISPYGKALHRTNPDKHEACALAIELRYQGSSPKEAPPPSLKCDDKNTEEVAKEEYAAGRYVAPKELFEKSRGGEIETVRRFRKKNWED